MPVLTLYVLLAILLAAQCCAGEEPGPALANDAPGPGKFVKQVAPEYEKTGDYHALYLPADWKPGQLYPVIVEYSGNQCPPICTGKVDDCRLGYFLSGGKGFLWVVFPFVNAQQKINQLQWWGDLDATAAYCLTNLRRICEQYGGDTSAIVLTGFSRGAIACGYVGLHDAKIADTWLAFWPHSHHDGGSFTAAGAPERLQRIAGRASLISWGEKDSGQANSLVGKKILDGCKFPVATLEIAGAPHTDRWIMHDCAERRTAREWLADVLRRRPGTHEISGTVADAAGQPVAGVRVYAGYLHWADSDAKGNFSLKGLSDGKRTLEAAKAGYAFAPLAVEVAGRDLPGQKLVGRVAEKK